MIFRFQIRISDRPKLNNEIGADQLGLLLPENSEAYGTWHSMKFIEYINSLERLVRCLQLVPSLFDVKQELRLHGSTFYGSTDEVRLVRRGIGDATFLWFTDDEVRYLDRTAVRPH